MNGTLADRLGLGPHELVAIVGAGGKTTILHALGHELASSGHQVVLTTTTRMASEQVTEPAVHGTDPARVDASFVEGAPLFVVAGHTAGKANGLVPAEVDRIFAETSADHVIAEADGARTMSIKAPADHEPVIPSATTTVVVVMGADALGRPIAEVAHRPERVAELTGTGVDAIVTADLAARVLLHTDGGMKNVPDTARVVIAITKVPPIDSPAVADLTAILTVDPGIDRCVSLPRPPTASKPSRRNRAPLRGGHGGIEPE